jgi:hypothetical protein
MATLILSGMFAGFTFDDEDYLMVSLLRVLCGFGKLRAKALLGRQMQGFAQSYEFCPNEACPDYGKLQKDQSKPNRKKIGFTRAFQKFEHA